MTRLKNAVGGYKVLLFDITGFWVVRRRIVIGCDRSEVADLSSRNDTESHIVSKESVGTIDDRSDERVHSSVVWDVSGGQPDSSHLGRGVEGDEGVDIVVGDNTRRGDNRSRRSEEGIKIVGDGVVVVVDIAGVGINPSSDMEGRVGGSNHVERDGEGVDNTAADAQTVGESVRAGNRGTAVDAVFHNNRRNSLATIVVDINADLLGRSEVTAFINMEVFKFKVNNRDVGDMDIDCCTSTFATVVEITNELRLGGADVHGVGISGHLP